MRRMEKEQCPTTLKLHVVLWYEKKKISSGHGMLGKKALLSHSMNQVCGPSLGWEIPYQMVKNNHSQRRWKFITEKLWDTHTHLYTHAAFLEFRFETTICLLETQFTTKLQWSDLWRPCWGDCVFSNTLNVYILLWTGGISPKNNLSLGVKSLVPLGKKRGQIQSLRSDHGTKAKNVTRKVYVSMA